MNRQRADKYFLNMLSSVAVASKDDSTKVSAIIVGPHDDIRSTGFNGLPRGIDDNNPKRSERPEKYLWYEHAERNAIYNAARHGTPLDGTRIYVSHAPCMDCARAIVQSGIIEVITPQPTKEFLTRWGDHFERMKVLFEEARIKLTIAESSNR